MEFQVLSPGSATVLLTRQFASEQEVESVLSAAEAAKASWRATPLGERLELIQKFVDHFASQKEAI